MGALVVNTHLYCIDRRKIQKEKARTAMVQPTTPKRSTAQETHRTAIRMAIAAGATVSALVGAQAFAILERSTVPNNNTSSVDSAVTTLPRPSTTPLPSTATPIATVALQPAPPHLAVFLGTTSDTRLADSSSQTANTLASPNSPNASMVPPAPVAIQAPTSVAVAAAPIVVQPAPAQPKPPTHTS